MSSSVKFDHAAGAARCYQREASAVAAMAVAKPHSCKVVYAMGGRGFMGAMRGSRPSNMLSCAASPSPKCAESPAVRGYQCFTAEKRLAIVNPAGIKGSAWEPTSALPHVFVG